MTLKSRKSWLSTLALVAGIVGFTLTGSVYADGNGCKSSSTSCSEGAGTCGFLSIDEGDFCVCNVERNLTPTCECSTGEYPPCGGGVEG